MYIYQVNYYYSQKVDNKNFFVISHSENKAIFHIFFYITKDSKNKISLTAYLFYCTCLNG